MRRRAAPTGSLARKRKERNLPSHSIDHLFQLLLPKISPSEEKIFKTFSDDRGLGVIKNSAASSIVLGILNSCCVGGLAKSQSITGRTLKTEPKGKLGKISRVRKRQWSSSIKAMENNANNSYSLEAHQSSGPTTVSEEIKIAEENMNTCMFVNQATIAWHDLRKEWVGDQSKKLHRAPREPELHRAPTEPVISWCTTYEDLLSTSQPFSQPIPLSEMVDFLVDIWHEEGLYD